MLVNINSHWLAIWGCRGVYSFFFAPGRWRPHINYEDNMDISKIKRWADNISVLELILMYERLIKDGRISKDGAASKRLDKLKEYRHKGIKILVK